ncbi:MAG: Maf family nucleotide pyrophosphatase [Bacteroidota bacterium]
MLINELKNYRIILGSRSPRRAQLLKDTGIRFELVHYHVKEKYPASLQGQDIAIYLAGQKSDAYPGNLGERDILITADTIVWCGNEVLHKPEKPSDAIRMLNTISGKTHQVYTGVCIRTAAEKRVFCASTDVTFCELTGEEIRYYVEKYKPFDKAGAYGIQEWIGYVGVERIEGSYFNVMGLPVHHLYLELKDLLASKTQE